jgi:hypothetical protein
MTARSHEGWPRWLAALLMGLLLVLALLIASWFLRTCASVESAGKVVMLEAEPPPPPPAPPDPTPVLKASLDEAAADEKKLLAELASLEADIKRRLAQCKPVELPKPPPPPPPVAQAPPPPPPPPPAPLPADRWAQKDLTMLQGCWRLGRDTRGTISGRREQCDVNAGRICFGANGSGQRQSTANCPGTGTITCTAPITARFGNDSTLGTTQPAVSCNPTRTQWTGPPNSLSCRRVSDTLALCRDGLNFEYEFRRE